MHIPDGLLDPATLIVLWIIVILVMILGFFRIGKVFEEEDSERLIPYIGVLAEFETSSGGMYRCKPCAYPNRRPPRCPSA